MPPLKVLLLARNILLGGIYTDSKLNFLFTVCLLSVLS
jgi:hypothetical protein